MKNIKYPKTDQKGRGKDGRKRNIVSLTKLRTDRERVKPQNLSPFEDIHVEDIHVTKTNPKSSIPSCITDFVTPKRLLLEVSPTISKKLKVSPTVDKRLVLGTGNPEIYRGKAFMDNFGYSNGVPEMKNVANLELRTLIDGNVEKSEACAQELDDESEMDPKGSKHRMVIITERRGFSEISSTINKEVDPGTGYEDNFSENESACSKNIVEKAAACATKLDDIYNMLRKKNEEAKELLARCIVNSNALMMLNHPMYDDKRF